MMKTFKWTLWAVILLTTASCTSETTESRENTGCRFTSDCPDPATQRCDMSSGQCVTKMQLDGGVTKDDCSVDSDCKDGRCLQGVCACRDENDCTNTSCVKGVVGTPPGLGICRCQGDTDCPNGRCVDGTCFANMCNDGETRACSGPCEGTQACRNGVWRPCPQPTAQEICGDERDNNCNGVVDEDCGGCTDGMIRPCMTECGVGEEFCAGGNWAFCNAPRAYPESCGNLEDEDCDGQTDEGCDNCENGETRPCQTACGDGVETCQDQTWGVCNAPVPDDEVCDGADNDCDGRADEDVARRCDNACGAGIQACKAGMWEVCTAPDACACIDSNLMDIQICGRCGQRTRSCEGDGMWGDWSECAEGFNDPDRCEPGEEGEQACGNCGTQTRRCTAECTWGGWQACTDEKECTPGTQEPLSDAAECGGLTKLCDMECNWTVDCSQAGPTACPMPGAEEVEECGQCGVRRRTCTECCQWSEWTECSGQGECEPGSTDAMACGPNCSVQERTCNAQCQWGPFGECSEGGQCRQGEEETRECGFCGMQRRACDAACIWEEWSDCDGQGLCAPGEMEEQACGESTGACIPGSQSRTCDGQCQWSEFGPCEGAVGPREEMCGSSDDEDCDGERELRPDAYEVASGAVDNNACGRCTLLNDVDASGDIVRDVDDTFLATIDQRRDVDYYCFDVNDGFNVTCTPVGGGCEHIRIELENIPVGRDYDIILYRNLADCTAGRPLQSSAKASNADESIDWREEAASDDDGRFYIKVYSAGGYSCDDNYLLRVDGLN